MTLIKTKQIDGTFIPEWLVDLFGRMKVSLPFTQLVINQSSAIASEYATGGQVSGTGGTVTALPNEAATSLSVGATTSLVRFRGSRPGLYQAGKPLLLYQTFVLEAGSTNVDKRVGYFYNNNGIYLELRGTNELSFCLRTGTSGSPVVSRVLQANWNLDKFDGTQLGYNFDLTKAHILFIAFEWLGVGDIVVGFIKDRTPIAAHVFSHSNALTGVYMSSPNLFPTWEIERTLAGTGTTTLKSICASLITEGTTEELGRQYAIRKTASYSTGTANTWRAIMLVRLNPAFLNSVVSIIDIDFLITSNNNCIVALVKAPTLSGAYTPTWTTLANTSIQYDEAITSTLSVTNADTSAEWMQCLFGNASIRENASYNNRIDILTSRFNDVPEVYAVCIRTDALNTTVASMVVNLWEQN